MDWLLILNFAADCGALASTAIALLFGYRAVAFSFNERTVEPDLRRQSDYAIYAGIASALAAMSFAVALLSI